MRDVQAVLKMFGFVGNWQTVDGKPTLAAFLEERRGKVRKYPCVVRVTGHFVAVSGWQFCDTISKGVVVEADDAPGRRKRVKNVFVITGRVPPSEIPRKDYSAAKARAATERKARDKFARFVSGLDGTYEVDRGDEWIAVTLSNGDVFEGNFWGWDVALDDLEQFLDDRR